MKKSIWIAAGGLAALALVLPALPSHSAAGQEPGSLRVRVIPNQDPLDLQVVDDEGPSWLGVETREVTSDTVKELKLPAERGVVVGRIAPSSPAAKAGLKENDVITELDGQRVEGSTQFRRMIREIPAGRTVQLTIWRDRHTETLSATLAQAEENHRAWMGTQPGAFAFRMPELKELPDVGELPDFPSIDLNGDVMEILPAHPRLGIDAEDISGQLGAYFGAPEDEGILVRNVNSGSPAEKAGLRAGDVITSFNGDRIRSLGDLRERLAGKNDKSVTLGVLRNKNQVTLSVELPTLAPKAKHKLGRSTNI